MLLITALSSMIALASAAEGETPPQSAVAAEQKASVRVRLEVNEQGVADKCEVIETDAPAELSEKVCPVFLEKARFKPPVDEDGKPKRATMTQKVTFVLKN